MKIIRISLAAALLFFAGCEILETDVPSAIKEFQVNLTGLPQLPDSLEYVAWLAGPEGSYFYRIEKFTPVNGAFSKTYTELRDDRVVGMQYLLVSIELKGLHDTVLTKPSDVPIIAGYIIGNSGQLNFFEDNSLPKFDGIKGNFILATPSDTLNTNENSGIWFVDKDSAGNPIAGLELPELPKGWFYQGWIEKDGQIFSTGHFQLPGVADEENLYSESSGTAYTFPGEDFLINPPSGINFPLDLIGAKVYITLQPKYDLKGSYNFKIFEAQVAAGSIPGQVYQLQKTTFTAPSGEVKLNWQI